MHCIEVIKRMNGEAKSYAELERERNDFNKKMALTAPKISLNEQRLRAEAGGEMKTKQEIREVTNDLKHYCASNREKHWLEALNWVLK